MPVERETARKLNGVGPREGTRTTIIAGLTGVTFLKVIPVGTATIAVTAMWKTPLSATAKVAAPNGSADLKKLEDGNSKS